MEAVLNITWAGQNGDLPDKVDVDSTDTQVLAWAEEALQQGGIPGITPDSEISLSGFVVERFPATGELPNRIMVRPKTEFGSC